MNIEVRLFAYFREGRGKKQFLNLSKETTIHSVIELLKIPVEEISILLLNGRDGSLDRSLADGDILAIFPPVGGG